MSLSYWDSTGICTQLKQACFPPTFHHNLKIILTLFRCILFPVDIFLSRLFPIKPFHEVTLIDRTFGLFLSLSLCFSLCVTLYNCSFVKLLLFEHLYICLKFLCVYLFLCLFLSMWSCFYLCEAVSISVKLLLCLSNCFFVCQAASLSVKLLVCGGLSLSSCFSFKLLLCRAASMLSCFSMKLYMCHVFSV
jgi:hypothetical protein